MLDSRAMDATTASRGEPPRTGRAILGLTRASATWLLALLAPPVIWWFNLGHFETRPANLLGLALQAGLAVLLGVLAVSDLHAAALAFIAIATRSTNALVMFSTVVGTGAGRWLVRRPEMPAAPPIELDRFVALLVATKDVLELAPRYRKRLLLSSFTLLLCFPFVEAASRARLRAIDRNTLQARLNEYYEVDRDNPHLYRPKKGYTKTFGDLIDVRSGSKSGARLKDERTVLDEALTKGTVTRSQALHMNDLGFKGEEFPRAKPPGERRVICIGDSCTFGVSHTSYSFVADNALASTQPRIRVVNGGVEGYSPIEATLRVPDYLAIEPDLVFIYIGWNSLYSDYEDPKNPATPRQTDDFLRSVLEPPSRFRLDSVTLLYRLRGRLALWAMERVGAAAPSTGPAPGKKWEAFQGPEGVWPRYTTRALELLLARLREGGIPKERIVIATIPGLLRTDRAPSPRALELAHLPAWARQNAYGLALASERYNAFIRELAAREGLGLVDLEAWVHGVDAPPEEVFFDSVHMNGPYQAVLGEYLAPILREAVERASKAR